MDRTGIVDMLRTHADVLRAHGVQGVDLFGSVARGETGAVGDVDVVLKIPADRKFSLLDIASVRVLLCDLTGADVDVVVDADLSPAFRTAIAADRYRVF